MSGRKGMKHYTESFKEQIRREYKEGCSVHSLQRKYKVSYWSVHCWCGLFYCLFSMERFSLESALFLY